MNTCSGETVSMRISVQIMPRDGNATELFYKSNKSFFETFCFLAVTPKRGFWGAATIPLFHIPVSWRGIISDEVLECHFIASQWSLLTRLWNNISSSIVIISPHSGSFFQDHCVANTPPPAVSILMCFSHLENMVEMFSLAFIFELLFGFVDQCPLFCISRPRQAKDWSEDHTWTHTTKNSKIYEHRCLLSF